MSRGILYLVWGDKAETALNRSISSLKEFHPELDCEVKRLAPDTDPFKGLLAKSRMMDFSPFDETLFLDAGTILLDRLDFGCAQALRFGLACCICECPRARRYRVLPKDDGIEYNTGVLFFTRGAEPLFRRWKALSSVVDTAIDYLAGDGRPRFYAPYANAMEPKVIEKIEGRRCDVYKWWNRFKAQQQRRVKELIDRSFASAYGE